MIVSVVRSLVKNRRGWHAELLVSSLHIGWLMCTVRLIARTPPGKGVLFLDMKKNEKRGSGKLSVVLFTGTDAAIALSTLVLS